MFGGVRTRRAACWSSLLPLPPEEDGRVGIGTDRALRPIACRARHAPLLRYTAAIRAVPSASRLPLRGDPGGHAVWFLHAGA